MCVGGFKVSDNLIVLGSIVGFLSFLYMIFLLSTRSRKNIDGLISLWYDLID